jgi:hypothetical protein
MRSSAGSVTAGAADGSAGMSYSSFSFGFPQEVHWVWRPSTRLLHPAHVHVSSICHSLIDSEQDTENLAKRR